MSALAKYCLICGFSVTGSDEKNSAEMQNLKRLGVKISVGHKAENVNLARVVVKSNAISDDNPEIVRAKELHIPIIKRSELLGSIMQGFSHSVAVSGSHGKTTATSMIAHMLEYGDKSPVAFIGGDDYKYGNLYLGNGDVIVCEACEFQKSFLDLKSTVAVALNLDNDHLDCYGSLENLSLAFRRFLSGKISVINADDDRLKRLGNQCTITFGISEPASYKAERLRKNGFGGYSFTVVRYGLKLGRINLKVLGKHNVYNALSTVVVGCIFGVPFKDIKKALEEFNGVKRRMENLGKLYKVTAYADYAHHPAEIKATLSAFGYKKGEDLVVFQPHTYSRTKLLMEDFISVLNGVETLVYSTYPAREEFDAKGSAYALYRNLKKQGQGYYYASNQHELFVQLKSILESKKRVIFIGAGDIYQIAKEKAEREGRK